MVRLVTIIVEKGRNVRYTQYFNTIDEVFSKIKDNFSEGKEHIISYVENKNDDLLSEECLAALKFAILNGYPINQLPSKYYKQLL